MKVTFGSIVMVVTVLQASNEVAALGINCRGSALCGNKSGAMDELRDLITDNINGVDPNYWFRNGEQIACSRQVCAFLQNTNGAPGQSIRDAIVDLRNHGCKACGSVPFYNNDVNLGMLTVNYVSHDCGKGVCTGALNPRT